MDSDSLVSLDPQPPPPLPSSLDTEEQLAKFREEWKAEVRRRKLEVAVLPSEASTASGLTQPTLSHHRQTVSSSPPAKGKEPSVHVVRVFGEATSKPILRHGQAEIDNVELLPQQRAALELYKRAIVCEQRGDLDEALQLYKKAFRGHDNIDRLYTHLEKIRYEQEKAGVHTSTSSHARPSSKEHTSMGKAVDHITRAMDNVQVAPRPLGDYVTGKLAEIISGWNEPLTFQPEEGREKEPCPIARMPDEMLIHVLARLDLASLERFAAVNRKTRVLTLESSIWRSFVQDLYVEPQIGLDEEVESILPEYHLDYRRMFIEHPRIRLDGLYIAVLHYIRNGLSENAWVAVNHLITYHRYLRFYPDGTVLSLLATEEVSPQQIIPILKPSLRMKGFFIGNWRLSGTDVFITDLTDPATGPEPPKHTFQMQLELKSKPRGRWNRLNFVTYESLTMDGEATRLLVKHDRPFWFSKVKSYGGL